MISPCIPITFIDYFMKLLYVTFFFLIYFLFKPRCAFLDALFTGTIFEALARQENIYSGTVNTDMLLYGCPYYPGVHFKLALWKKVTDT